MTLLVTGSSGKVGRRVVAGLVGAGQRVRAMARDSQAAAALLPAGTEVVQGDFERPETWAAVLDGVERVHLFPFAGGSFVEAAVAAGTRRFVVHSAVAAGFDPAPAQGPGQPHGSALRRHLDEERDGHRMVELAVEASGAEWTHVRPGLLASGALDWAEEIRGTGAVRAPYPKSGSALVHEADVAEIAVAALLTDEHLGAAYTITGPEKVTQLEQVRLVGEAIGEEVRFVELTPEQARAEWYDPEQGVDHELLDWVLELRAALADEPELIPATDTYERLTGRPPRTFAQWARDHRADFQVSGREGRR
ncbi:NAD(P)H-binding protein [Nonomuraea sp. NPDC059023]|uniref:NAD(P)H-binding protein n=1 Tax=unclassified Nonomuraea TaxID=2593643 RepID=UPI00368BD0FF